MLQLETPMETVCRAAEIAAAAGVPVILNPAPAAPLPDHLWPHLTCLTPNESEAERLTGVAVSDEAGARRAAAKLLAKGVRAVVVTSARKGRCWWMATAQSLVPSRTVDAVDTTAAGDAFNGGLAWALASGRDLPAAVRQACLVGALSATRLGAQPSLPTYEEFVRFAGAPAEL